MPGILVSIPLWSKSASASVLAAQGVALRRQPGLIIQKKCISNCSLTGFLLSLREIPKKSTVVSFIALVLACSQ